MNKLRLAVIVSLAALPTAGITLVACSSDSVVNVNTDSGTPDVFVPTDSGADVTEPKDAGADAFDGGFVQQTYDTTIATAMCLYLSRCCYGTTAPADGGIDGGSFNLQECIATYKPTGYDLSNVDITLADPAKITIDQTLSKQCVDGINAASCTPAATAFRQLRTTCFGAVKGSVAEGGSCKYSIECAAGFCKPTDPEQKAGSAGTCAPLRAAGDSCADTFNYELGTAHANTDEEACSTRGSGDTNRFCDYNDNSTNPPGVLPRDQWKCADARVNGSSCNLDSWCSEGICSPTTPTSCVDSLTFFPADTTCKQFVH